MSENAFREEGVIKYSCTWQQTPAGSDWDITRLTTCREWLYAQKLIGVNAEGIGYGNISERKEGDQFIISGSSTGHLPVLDTSKYSLVTGFEIDKNQLSCCGPAQASSESMTHGVLYRADVSIGAVIHVHHEAMWRFFVGRIPTTASDVPYGTPAMAHEIRRLYHTTDLPRLKFLAMGGHFEGLITFGASLDEALHILESKYQQFLRNG